MILFAVSLLSLKCKYSVYGVFEEVKQPFSVMLVEIVDFKFSYKVLSVQPSECAQNTRTVT